MAAIEQDHDRIFVQGVFDETSPPLFLFKGDRVMLGDGSVAICTGRTGPDHFWLERKTEKSAESFLATLLEVRCLTSVILHLEKKRQKSLDDDW